MKDSISINLGGKNLIIEYDCDYEKMNLGSGSGDSGSPSCSSLNIVSIYADEKDWVDILEAYHTTKDLLDAIKETVSNLI